MYTVKAITTIPSFEVKKKGIIKDDIYFKLAHNWLF